MNAPIAFGLAAALAASCQPSLLHLQFSDGPRELGRVNWGKRLDDALETGVRDGRPVLLLFQEIPGWSTCRAFGEGPLSLPLLVEAAETLFVPVAIRNNVGGYEKEVRERYEEPAWNNPVVRFLDAKGKDVIPRKAGVWGTGGMLARMTRVLRAAERPVPAWLDLVTMETGVDAGGGDVDVAAFAMTWFWTGEARLGSIPGVVSTQAAWHAGREVVEVRYRPEELAFDDLLAQARAAGVASHVYTTNAAQLEIAREQLGDRAEPLAGEVRAAKDSDQLYYLRRSPLRYLPLTPLQAIRVNAALGTRGTPEQWLSPRQVALAKRIRAVDSKRLVGLERPAHIAGLAAFEAGLIERLQE